MKNLQGSQFSQHYCGKKIRISLRKKLNGVNLKKQTNVNLKFTNKKAQLYFIDLHKTKHCKTEELLKAPSFVGEKQKEEKS